MPRRTDTLRYAALAVLLIMVSLSVVVIVYASSSAVPGNPVPRDDFAGSKLVAAVVQATTTSIPTATATATATVEVTSEVTPTPPPVPNDYIEYATEITALPYTISQPLALTTYSYSDPQPSCWYSYFRNSIWFRYTPAVDQRVMFDAVNSDDQANPELAVFTGIPGALTLQGCSSRANTQGIDLMLTAGTTYTIMGAAFIPTPATTQQYTLNVAVVPPVANDAFANAIQIPALPFSFQQNVYASTVSASDPSISCGYSYYPDYRNSVWFQYTPSVDQIVMVNAEGSTLSADVAVFTGNQGSLTEQVCNYSGADTLSAFSAHAGVTYSILVARDGLDPLTIFGEVVLHLFTVPEVANDEFANATHVTDVPFEQTIDVYGSTSDPTDPGLRDYCLYSDPRAYPNTVWYRYVPTTDHALSISTDGSDYRTLMGVYTLDGSSLVDYACSGNAYLSTGVQAGVTYYVMIASADNYDRLPLDHSALLHVRFDLPPVPNDLIQDATVVDSFPFSVEQNVYGSTLSPDDPEGCTTNFQSNSVWFSYTPAQSLGIILDATTSDYQAAVKIYTQAGGGALIEQGCGFGSIGLQVHSGVPYLIMVSRLEGGGQPVLQPADKLRLQITTPVVANDLIENAIQIASVPYSHTQDVFGSTTTISDPTSPSGSNCYSHVIYDLNRLNTVWYTYTAAVTQTLVIETAASDYPTYIELPDQQICGYGVRTFEAQAGVTYRIKVAYQNNGLSSVMPLAQPSLLRFNLHPTLFNDTQANALAINTIPFNYTEDVTSATVDQSEPSGYTCGDHSQSVWFKYTPDANRTVLIDTSGSDYSTVVALYIDSYDYGCAPHATEPQQAKLTLNARAGTTYYIAVMNHSATPTLANLHLSITDTTNSHAIANARVIPTTALTYQDTQDLGNAKDSVVAPYLICGSLGDSGYQNTFWYRYSAALDMSVHIDSLVTVGYIVANVYDADTMQLINCDRGWAFRAASVNFTAQAGKTYYILIGEDTHVVSGTDPWLNQLNFTADLVAQPTALGPSGTTRQTKPAFTWTPVPGVASYELTLTPDAGVDSTFNVNAAANCTADLCSFTPTAALALGGYHWSVRGWNNQLGYTLPSATLAFEITTDLVANGKFDYEEIGWNFFGEVGYSVNAGVLDFNRSMGATEAIIFQDITATPTTGTKFELDLDLGNSSAGSRTINVVLRKLDWSNSAICQFVLAPNSPLRTHVLQGITASDWSSIRLEISSVEEDTSTVLHLDNVSLTVHPELSITATNCISPDLPNTNAVTNGTFNSDLSGWNVWDGMVSQWNSGQMNLYRSSGSGAGTAYQIVGAPVALNSHIELDLDMGNSSGADKRMVAIVRNSDWSGYLVCPFLIPANTGMHTYKLKGRPIIPWTDTIVELSLQSADSLGWLQVDNVSLHHLDVSEFIWATECDSFTAPDGLNIVRNGDFAAGLEDWSWWGGILPTVSGEAMQFNRQISAPGASVFQFLNFTTAPGMKLTMSFDLSNSANVPQDFSIIMRKPDWTEWLVCPFTIPANSGPTTYTMSGASSGTWENILLEMQFFTDTANPSLTLDNVSAKQDSSLLVTDTVCGNPNTPLSVPTPTEAPPAGIVESDDPAVGQTDGWVLMTQPGGTSGGSYLINTAPDDSLAVNFSGTYVDIIYLTGPSFGSFRVEVDGASIGTVPTAAETYGVNAQALIDGLAPGEHQLRLVVEAGVVGIDAFSASAILPLVALTEEATLSPTEEVTVAPTEEATVAPTEEVTVAPTDEVTLAPTEEVTVAPTEEVTVAPTEGVTVAPTEEATLAPTEEVTAAPSATPTVEPPTALPFPTVDIGTPVSPTETPTEPPTAMPTLGAPLDLPTARVFPTVDIGTSVPPTETPTATATEAASAPVVLTLPALASFDDGAADWSATAGWALAAHDAGQAWLMSSAAAAETLTWGSSLDLTTAAAPLLTFESQFAGAGVASVQVSTDGGATWSHRGNRPDFSRLDDSQYRPERLRGERHSVGV